MRLILTLLLSFLLAPAWAQVPMTGAGKGTPAVIVPSPGNVVGSASMWWGLRAYSSATKGSAAISLCDDAGANCSDVLTDATTGALANPGTHGSNDCSTSNTCRIQTFYDQSGALACSGSTACDATQGTNSARPVLVWSCLNGKPCARFSAASSQILTTPALSAAINQPWAISTVVSRTGAFTSFGGIIGSNANPQWMSFRNATNTVQLLSNVSGQIVANISDSNFHALQATFNGASSVIFCGGGAGTNCSVAGTSNGLSPGTQALAAAAVSIGNVNSTGFLTGDFTEGGIWALDFTASSRQSDMVANQYAYWGPF